MYIDFVPQTSVALGVLAALVEDSVCNTGPIPVRGSWPPVVSRGAQGYSVVSLCDIVWLRGSL